VNRSEQARDRRIVRLATRRCAPRTAHELSRVRAVAAVETCASRTPPFEAAVHWVFAEDIDATYDELKSSGAKIVEPLEKKPWGLRQFTVEDLDGNRFHFHHD